MKEMRRERRDVMWRCDRNHPTVNEWGRKTLFCHLHVKARLTSSPHTHTLSLSLHYFCVFASRLLPNVYIKNIFFVFSFFGMTSEEGRLATSTVILFPKGARGGNCWTFFSFDWGKNPYWGRRQLSSPTPHLSPPCSFVDLFCWKICKSWTTVWLCQQICTDIPVFFQQND